MDLPFIPDYIYIDFLTEATVSPLIPAIIIYVGFWGVILAGLSLIIYGTLKGRRGSIDLGFTLVALNFFPIMFLVGFIMGVGFLFLYSLSNLSEFLSEIGKRAKKRKKSSEKSKNYDENYNPLSK